MDDPNITMTEYIQLVEEKVRRHDQEFNWETATYGKVTYFEDIDYFKDFENRFPAIVYNDALTSEPEVSSDFENEFPSIVYNDALTSKLETSSEPTVTLNHAIKVDFDFKISSSDSDDEDYTNTPYYSRPIRRIQDFDELKDHCLTLKNTSYPHQRYAVYNTLVNKEEPTGFTSIHRQTLEDSKRYQPWSLLQEIPNTPYPASPNMAYRPFSRLYNEYNALNSVLEEILERAHMQNCNPYQTPVDIESNLGSNGDPVSDPTLYRSLAGTLQYLTFTRPDLSYVVYAYTDANWAGCLVTCRSTSGYCVFLGDNILSWSVKHQVTLSRSSAEAEHRGVANVVAETAWIHSIFTKGLPTALFIEFRSSLNVRRSPAHTEGEY
ncbi:ribonuclease H-like domain-containing protein [Tanacetum coccineum]